MAVEIYNLCNYKATEDTEDTKDIATFPLCTLCALWPELKS